MGVARAYAAGRPSRPSGTARRALELLVYGIFSAFEEDQGYHSTAWVELSDVLMSIEREVLASKIASFRDDLARALDQAMLVPPAAAPPAASSPAAASPEVA